MTARARVSPQQEKSRPSAEQLEKPKSPLSSADPMQGWSSYRAKRSQAVATGRNPVGCSCLESGKIRPDPLPSVATGCQWGRVVIRWSEPPFRAHREPGGVVKLRARSRVPRQPPEWAACCPGTLSASATSRGHKRTHQKRHARRLATYPVPALVGPCAWVPARVWVLIRLLPGSP
jgi:hypothetical protein